MPVAGALPYDELGRIVREKAARPRVHATPVWLAESFRETEGEPMTIRRAKALNRVLACSPLTFTPGELVVGGGNVDRFVPAGTFPDQVLRAAGATVGTIGRRSFASHSDHHAPDYAKLLRLGFGGLRREVRASVPRQDGKGAEFLQSVDIALEGASAYCRRWTEHVRQSASDGGPFESLLTQQAADLAHIAEAPPETFRQALQLVLLYHHMMQLDDRGAMAFGRLDRVLLPYYRNDRDAGRDSVEGIQDALDHFFVKITIDGDVQNITLGGTDPRDGSDAGSELTLQILEACKRVGRPGGNCTVRVHSGTSPRLLAKCAEVIRTGVGYPAVVSEEPIIRGLIDHGYRPEDARDYCCVGCIETQIPGKQAPWADGRANPLYALNLAVFDGVDSLTGERRCPPSGDPESFEGFYAKFLARAREQIAALIRAADAAQRPCHERAGEFTAPLLSALVDDCIARGRDVNDGGAVYPGCFGFASMGIASVADSLEAMRRFVYDGERFTPDELRTILRANFEGYEAERREILAVAPKFGNDDGSVDTLAARVVRDLAAEYRRYRTPGGGHYFMLLGANVQNISAGREVGATPDGRLAGQPLSDAASPTFGRDVNGPTAVIRSVAKLPYHLCAGGNVVNLKLDPACLQGDRGIERLAAMIRTCFALGGQELQFNTTGSETLRAAMEHPEEYPNLVVRVSGFSALFSSLDRAVKEDILARTEHRI